MNTHNSAADIIGTLKGKSPEVIRAMAAGILRLAAEKPPKNKKGDEAAALLADLSASLVGLRVATDALVEQYRLEVQKGDYSGGSLSFADSSDAERRSALVADRQEKAQDFLNKVRGLFGDEAAEAVSGGVAPMLKEESPTNETALKNTIVLLAGTVLSLKGHSDVKGLSPLLKDANSAILSRARPANTSVQLSSANVKAGAAVAVVDMADSLVEAYEAAKQSGKSAEASSAYASFRSKAKDAGGDLSSIMLVAHSPTTGDKDKGKIARGLSKVMKHVGTSLSHDNIGISNLCEGVLMLLSAMDGSADVEKARKAVNAVYNEVSSTEEALTGGNPSSRKEVFQRKRALMSSALQAKKEALQSTLRHGSPEEVAKAEKELVQLQRNPDYGGLLNDLIEDSLGDASADYALHETLRVGKDRLRAFHHGAIDKSLKSLGPNGLVDAIAKGDTDALQALTEGLTKGDEDRHGGSIPKHRLEEAEASLNALHAMAKRDPRALEKFLASKGSKEGADSLISSMEEAGKAAGGRLSTYKALAEDERVRSIDRGPTGYGSHGLSIVPVSKVESEAEGSQQLQGVLSASKAHHFVRRKPWDAAVKDMITNVKNLDGVRIKNNVFDPRKGAQEVLMWAKSMGNGVLRAEAVDQAIKAQVDHYKEAFSKDGDGKEKAKAEHEGLLRRYDEEYQRLENLKEAEAAVEEGWLHTSKLVQEARDEHLDTMSWTKNHLDKTIPQEQREKLVAKQRSHGRKLYEKHFLLKDKIQDHTIPGDLDRETLEGLLGLNPGQGVETLTDEDLASLLASHMKAIERKSTPSIEYKNNPQVTKAAPPPKSPVSGAMKARAHLDGMLGMLRSASEGSQGRHFVLASDMRTAAMAPYDRSVAGTVASNSWLAHRFDSIMSGDDAEQRRNFLEATRKHFHGVDSYGDEEESAASGETPLGETLAKKHPLPGKLMRSAMEKLIKHDKALDDAQRRSTAPQVIRQRLLTEYQKLQHHLPEKPVRTLQDEMEDLKTLRSMYKGDLDILNDPSHPYAQLKDRHDDMEDAVEYHRDQLEKKRRHALDLQTKHQGALDRYDELMGKVNSGTASAEDQAELTQVARKSSELEGKRSQAEDRVAKTRDYLDRLSRTLSRTKQSMAPVQKDEKEALDALDALDAHISTMKKEVSDGKYMVGKDGDMPIFARDLEELEENLFNTITDDLNAWKRRIAAQQKVVDDLADKVRAANKMADEGVSEASAEIWAMEMVGSMWQEIMNTWKSKKIQFSNLHQVDDIDWQDVMAAVKDNVGLVNDRALVAQLYELKELERTLKGLLNSGKVHSRDTVKSLLDKASKLGGGKAFSEGTTERKLIEGAMEGQLYDFKTILDNLRMRKRLVWLKMNSLKASREVVEVAKAVEASAKAVAPGKNIVSLKEATEAVAETKEAAAEVNKLAADDAMHVSSEKKVPLSALGKLLVEALGW